MNENEIKGGIRQMKKTHGILLVVCFLMSVTAASVSAESVVVKEKKNATTIMKNVKAKIFKHHHHKNATRDSERSKKMGMKTGNNKNIPMKTEKGKDMTMKTGADKNIPIKTETNKDMPMNS